MLNIYFKHIKVIILSFALVLACSNFHLYAKTALSENYLLKTFNNESNSSKLKNMATGLGNEQDKDVKELASFSNIALEELVKENATELPEYGVVYKYDNKIAKPLKIVDGSEYEVLVGDEPANMKVLLIKTRYKYIKGDLLRMGYYAYAGIFSYTTTKGDKVSFRTFMELETK